MSEYRSNNAEMAANQDNESIAQKHLDAFWKTLDVTVVRDGACKNFDALYRYGDAQFTVEEKFRRIESVRGDVILEIVQALESMGWGWFTKTTAERLAYVLCDLEWRPVKLYSFRFGELRRWYLTEYLPRHRMGTYVCSTYGYGVTINLSLPLKEIPRQFYKELSCAIDEDIPF